jgi:hypothetical protein
MDLSLYGPNICCQIAKLKPTFRLLCPFLVCFQTFHDALPAENVSAGRAATRVGHAIKAENAVLK